MCLKPEKKRQLVSIITTAGMKEAQLHGDREELVINRYNKVESNSIYSIYVEDQPVQHNVIYMQ